MASSAFVACVVSAQAGAQTNAIQDITPQPPAEPRPIEDKRLLGKQQVNGDARWTTELGRQIYALCPGDVIVEALARGVDINDANKRMTENCARNTLFVRNDSAGTIQCKALLEYARPDHLGATRLEEDRVLLPGMESATIHSYANARNAPTSSTASWSRPASAATTTVG